MENNINLKGKLKEQIKIIEYNCKVNNSCSVTEDLNYCYTIQQFIIEHTSFPRMWIEHM